jgi:hypothetical protein
MTLQVVGWCTALRRLRLGLLPSVLAATRRACGGLFKHAPGSTWYCKTLLSVVEGRYRREPVHVANASSVGARIVTLPVAVAYPLKVAFRPV